MRKYWWRFSGDSNFANFGNKQHRKQCRRGQIMRIKSESTKNRILASQPSEGSHLTMCLRFKRHYHIECANLPCVSIEGFL